MPDPEPRTDPPGTVYGARPATRPGLPRDPLMRIALGVAVVGVLLGLFFATGVLGGGGDQPVLPAVAAPTPVSSEPAAPATTEVAPATPAEPSPTPAATTAAAPVAGPKVFRAVTSGRCVGVAADDPEGADAQLADCTGGPEQQWVATPVGTDVWTLTNAASGKCLDVDGQRTDDGVDVQQWSCNGQPNQQWRLTPTGAGPVLLIAVHSGKCAQLDDTGQLQQAPCSPAPTQQFTLG